MASINRRGTIPHPTTGVGEHVDEVFTIGGFFGPWIDIFRARNLAHPVAWSDDSLLYQGVDAAELAASSAPDALPTEVLVGDTVTVSLLRRSGPPPFAEKLVDRHQIRFYDRGRFLLETELGPLTAEAGDFAVIPANLVYRERPLDEDNLVVIFETAEPICLAESLWDSVGFAGMFIDYSEMELPRTGGRDGTRSEPTTLRGARLRPRTAARGTGWITTSIRATTRSAGSAILSSTS